MAQDSLLWLREHSSDGHCSIDRNGIVTAVNATACQLAGYPDNEWIGQDLHALLHPQCVSKSFANINECELDTAIRAAKPQQGETILHCKDDISLTIKYYFTAVNYDQPDAGRCLMFSESAPGSRLALDLQQRTEEISSLQQQLNDFCSTMRHDLKAPLRSIKFMASLLCEHLGEDQSASVQEDLHFINKAVLDLQGLVERLRSKDTLSTAVKSVTVSPVSLGTNEEAQTQTELSLLLVDDSAADQKLMEHYLCNLAQWHISIHNCSEASLLQSVLQARQYDLVLMDYKLGSESGIDLIARNSATYPYSAFILLTGQGDEKVATQALRAGAIDYWLKDEIGSRFLQEALTKVMARQQDIRQRQMLLRAVPDAVIIINQEGIIEELNPAGTRIFAYQEQELIGQAASLLISPKFRQHYQQSIKNYLASEQGSELGTVWEIEGLRKNAESFPMEISISAARVFGKHRFMAVIRDITERKQQQVLLQKQASIIHATQDLVIYSDVNGEVQFLNLAGAELLDIDSNNTEKLALAQLFAPQYLEKINNQVIPVLMDKGTWRGELELLSRQGNIIPVSMVANRIVEADKVTGFAAIMHDISEERAVQNRLQHIAEHDALTGLVNRHLFTQLLSQAVARAKRHHALLAILFIDLDGFKGINDTLGHDAGDKLLNIVAKRLSRHTRECDVVARLGGDEFVVLIEDLKAINHAAIFAYLLLDALGQTVTLKQQEVCVTPSIGIATYPVCGRSMEELLSAADLAMYQAKEQGRNQFRIYSQALHETICREEMIKQGLYKAMTEDQCYLLYQPIVNQHDKLSGFEALLRWQAYDELIMPAEFIPVAEAYGFINPLGNMVLDTALAQLSEWRCRLNFKGYVAINVSLQQLKNEKFVERLRQGMESFNIPASALQLEITESLFMEDIVKYQPALNKLASLKVAIAIDDFGTGYASFRHLQMLPISTLKIDRCFVSGLPDNSTNAKTIDAIISLAQSLSLRIIIEGVETAQEAQYLARYPCDKQGYHYDYPLTVAEAEKRLY